MGKDTEGEIGRSGGREREREGEMDNVQGAGWRDYILWYCTHGKVHKGQGLEGNCIPESTRCYGCCYGYFALGKKKFGGVSKCPRARAIYAHAHAETAGRDRE